MSNQTVTAPADEPYFIIDRLLDAPRELIWKMYTDPVHMVHFWGPAGSTLPVCKVDLRVGGAWIYTMRWPDGGEYTVSSVYLELVEPERIVFRDGPTGGQDVEDLAPPVMVSTIQLDDAAGRTRMSVTVRFNTIPARDEAIERGFANVVGQSGDRLDVYLKTL